MNIDVKNKTLNTTSPKSQAPVTSVVPAKAHNDITHLSAQTGFLQSDYIEVEESAARRALISRYPFTRDIFANDGKGTS